MAPPDPTPLPTPQQLASADLRKILRDSSRKQAFVTPMFEHIAPRYDAFTRWFSFGMDATWKRELLAMVTEAPTSVLDLACGTGDLAFGMAQRFPGASVVGIDVAAEMVRRASLRSSAASQVSFRVGDLMALDVPPASVDAITAGYAYRNAPSLTEALAAARQALRPGGRLYTLDFYRPPSRVWRSLFLGYLRAAGGVYGWWWHRAPVIYSYIAHSIDAWVSIADWERALHDGGFTVEVSRSRLMGGIALHTAQRR